MRAALWTVLIAVVLSGLVTPLAYLHAASELPALDTEHDLEVLLRMDVEAERLTDRMGRGAGDLAGVRFERPKLARVPKELVSLYLSQRGCAGYLRAPREEGPRWAWRMLIGVFGVEPAGDGWCDRLFAWRLATRIGVKGALQESVAAHKIRTALGKEQLVAYDLASIWFEEAVVGVEAAAQRLFGKPLDRLELSQLGELALAMPPHNQYRVLRDCQNPSLIRQNRDVLLGELAGEGRLPEVRVKRAQAAPVTCAR